MTKNPKSPFTVGAVLLALLCGAIVWIAGTSTDDAKSDSKSSTSLTGEWHQTRNGIYGADAEARVTDDMIQINLTIDGSESIYWLGTFDTSKDPAEPFAYVSRGDTGKMATSLFGSRDETKKFKYRDGQLSFRFTITGTTTIVQLEK